MAKTKKAAEPVVVEREGVVKLMEVAFGLKKAKKETNEWLSEKLSNLADQIDEDDLETLKEEDAESHELAETVLKGLKAGATITVVDDEEDGADDSDSEVEDDDSETEVEDDDDSEEDDESDTESDDSEDDEEPEDDEEDEVEDVKPKKGKAAKVVEKPAKKGKEAAKPVKKGAKEEPKKTKKAEVKKPAKEKKERKPRGKGVIYYIIRCLSQATSKKPITKDKIVAFLVKKFPEREESSMRVTCNTQMGGMLKHDKGITIGKDGKGGYWIDDMGDYELPE